MSHESSQGRGFAGGALVMMGGTALAQAIPILVAPILTRLYTPVEFGALATFIGVATVISVAATFRLEPAIVLPPSDRVAASLAVTSLSLAACISLLILVVGAFGKPWIASWWPAVERGGWLPFLAPMVLLLSIAQIASFWANRKRRYASLAKGAIAQQGGTAAFSLWFGLGALLTPGLVAARLLGQLLAACWLLISVLEDWRTSFPKVTVTGMKAAVREYRRFPQFNLPYSLIGTASREALVLALTVFHFVEAAGFYGLARSVLFMPVSFLSASLSQVFYKEAADSIGSRQLEILTKRLLNAVVMLFTPGFVALVLWGPELFAFVFGPGWRTAGVYAAIFAPAAYLFLFSSWPERLFEVTGRQRTSLIIQLTFDSLSISIVLALLSHGVGPIPALAAFTAVACGYHCTFLAAAFRVAGFPSSILWHTAVRGALTAGAAALVLGVGKLLMEPLGMILAVVCTAAYTVAAVAWLIQRHRAGELGKVQEQAD